MIARARNVNGVVSFDMSTVAAARSESTRLRNSGMASP